jgi:hypothetical protein
MPAWEQEIKDALDEGITIMQKAQKSER